MLATLTDARFSDPEWIYERKLDGVRLLVFRDGGELRLMTRNRKERGATYPELRDALQGGPDLDFVADGEVVAFDGAVTSFARLQSRIQVEDEEEARRRSRDVPVLLYLFDLLHLDGHDLTAVPLRDRKKVLKATLDWQDPIRFTPHRNRDGVAYWRTACEKGWEGVIAKDATAPYVHGRSRTWLKFKCVHRQELVVGGFTEPQGERVGFGALLLGYHRDGDLIYAGKVGTGWDDDALRTLRRRMDGLERKTPPYAGAGSSEESPPENADLPRNGVHWLTPRLVVEVGFTEWTDDGRLRHPRYLGIREDKDASDVVRERPG
jgi:bifunctional non-homologous end joining protein LigD